MFADAIIVFDQDNPVESTIVCETLSFIESVVRRANEDILNNILSRHPEEAKKFFANTAKTLKKDNEPSVYITSTPKAIFTYDYPKDAVKSKKPTTLAAKLKAMAFVAVASSVVAVGGPAVLETEIVKDTQASITDTMDEYYGYIRERFDMEPSVRRVTCEKKDGVFIFIVTPSPEDVEKAKKQKSRNGRLLNILRPKR